MTDEDSPVQFKYTGAHHGYVVGVATQGILHNIVIYVILQLHGSGCGNALAHSDDRSTVGYLKYTLVWFVCAKCALPASVLSVIAQYYPLASYI